MKNEQYQENNNMNYRLATKSDIDAICDMICRAIKEMESHHIFQWDDLYPTREDFLADIEAGNLYLGMEEDNLAVIYVISRDCDEAYMECHWNGKDEQAYILHRLCVAPEFQNKGVGKNVLKHIEGQIKAMGFVSVRLDVYSENPYALKLYEKAGYVKCGHADWRKGRFWLMEKLLQE